MKSKSKAELKSTNLYIDKSSICVVDTAVGSDQFSIRLFFLKRVLSFFLL